MKPYINKRLTPCPDVADIQVEGRNTSAGGKDYFKNKVKKRQIRRHLKRQDKQRSLRDDKSNSKNDVV